MNVNSTATNAMRDGDAIQIAVSKDSVEEEEVLRVKVNDCIERK